MAIVQNIIVDEMPNVMDFLTTDRVRQMSENIRIESEQRFNNMFGNIHYEHQNEREMFLNVFKRHSDSVKEIIDNTLHNVFMDDRIVCIDSKEKLMKGVPKTMELALITSPKLREALEKDEIYGFGLHPKDLPMKDTIGRMINNGATNENGIGIAYITSDDPIMSIDDLNNIEDTRYFMELLLDEGIDPTDYPNKKGKIK